jgi:hypothetical protein
MILKVKRVDAAIFASMRFYTNPIDMLNVIIAIVEKSGHYSEPLLSFEESCGLFIAVWIVAVLPEVMWFSRCIEEYLPLAMQSKLAEDFQMAASHLKGVVDHIRTFLDEKSNQ